MEPGFWIDRWARGRIGWHRDEVTPLLRERWREVQADKGCRVLVPLCGKSVDMPWLAINGHRVLGVDLAQAGIDAYLAEQQFEPRSEATAAGPMFDAGPVQLLCADIFDVPADMLATCSAIYDRAALIALPPAMRRRYVAHVHGSLPPGSSGLLITLEYPQQEKDGPPFSVDEDEVRSLLEPAWEVTLLERRNILRSEPRFLEAGVTRLHTAVYRLRKH
ncbi:MAG: thiopurine S-methyltransferase [Pseudoxanthomonas suwonensis]|nr:thiopurine S-methyltransferase [Pseudoxanthomonas suwonensis]